MIFVELPLFSKYAPFTDEELRALQNTLVENPLASDPIRGGKGLRNCVPHWVATANAAAHG